MDAESTVSSFHLPVRLSEADLMPIVSRKLAAQDMPPVHRIDRCKLSYHPYWRFETGGTKALYISAAFSSVLDMSELYAPGDKPSPFNPSNVNAPVAIPDTHHAEATHTFQSAWADSHPSGAESAASIDAASLVYLPIYDLTYEVSKKRYHACVDGVWGMVFADDWPANIDREKTIVLGAIGGVMSVSFLLEAILISLSIPLLLALGVTAAVVYFGGLYALEHLERKGNG